MGKANAARAFGASLSSVKGYVGKARQGGLLSRRTSRVTRQAQRMS
jgi:hypothetical protein